MKMGIEMIYGYLRENQHVAQVQKSLRSFPCIAVLPDLAAILHIALLVCLHPSVMLGGQ